ncbi:MAG: hypothetical protein ABSA23_04720, partial [Anaerolineales bacterium]
NTTTALLGSVIGFTSMTGAAFAAVAAIRADISAAADEQTALTQLNATLESTGRTGETSAASLDKIAASPLFTTTQIDQAANALARFVDIPSEQLGPDMLIIENMAEALGTDLPSAAQRFGQAMETGQTRGMGFSRELTNQISKLMTAGDIQQADAIILDQLSQKYSGQAAVALDTYNGKVQALKASWDEHNASAGQAYVQEGLLTDIIGGVTGAITESTDRQNTLNEAKALGIQVDTDAVAGMVIVNNNYMTYAQLLDMVTAKQDAQNASMSKMDALTQTDIDTIGRWKASFSDATTVTDIFTGALIEATNANKQEGAELDFITGYAKTYQQGIDNIANATKNAQKNITDYTNDLDYFQNLEQNGPAILEYYRDKLDEVAKQYGVNSKAYDDEKKILSDTEQNYKGAGGAIDYYNGKLQEETDQIDATKKAAKDATDEMIAGYLQTELAAEGVVPNIAFTKVLDFRLSVGLLTMDEYNAAIQAMAIADNLAGIQDKTVTVTINESINQKVNRIDNPPLPSTTNQWTEGKPQATGGDYIVNKPTTFLAGEAGPERATFTPLGGASGGGGGNTIYLNVNGAGDPGAVAREVIRQLGTTVNLQGARTRL